MQGTVHKTHGMPVTELPQIWGERIRKLRTERGLSRVKFAHLVDVDPSNVWRIENGYVAPSDATRVRIAEALGLRVEDIFTYPDTREAS